MAPGHTAEHGGSPHPLPSSPRDPEASGHLIANEDNPARNQDQRKGCGRSMPVHLGQSRIPSCPGLRGTQGFPGRGTLGKWKCSGHKGTSWSPCFQYLTVWIRVLRDWAFCAHVSSIFSYASADCGHSGCVSEPDCVSISVWCVCVFGDVCTSLPVTCVRGRCSPGGPGPSCVPLQGACCQAGPPGSAALSSLTTAH